MAARAGFGVLGAALGLVCLPAVADEPNWPTVPIAAPASPAELRGALTAFADATGLRLELSDKIDGVLRGKIAATAPKDYLNALVRANGLEWYFDGTEIWVSPLSENQTQLLALRAVDIGRLKQGLSAAGLMDSRYLLKDSLAPAAVVVSGPPRYVALVEQAIGMLAGDAPPTPVRAEASAAGSPTASAEPGGGRALTVIRFGVASEPQL